MKSPSSFSMATTSKKGRKCLGGKGNFALRARYAADCEISMIMAVPTSSSGSPLLSVRDVSVRFGGIVALDGVTFDVYPGQIAGLIGPNGAGKTTLFNCLSRLYTPSGGDILFEGKSILGRPRHHIPQIGIGRTFQNVALFDKMSVLDNVKVGCHSAARTSFLANALRLPRSRRGARITERARRADRVHGPRAVHRRLPAACRSRSASASNWRVRWPPAPSCCCSTSRPPA